MDIKYSFIIPHKNSLKLLDRCISSIPERDDVEIIIVDDNSDENQKPHLNRNNCVTIHLDSNISKGAGRARNIGISKSKGQWLLFADADDFYSSNFLEILDGYSQSNADVVYFEIKVLKNNLEIQHNYTYVKSFFKDPSTIDELKYKFQVPWNKMVKRNFIIDNKIRFEESLVGNDIFFSYQVGYFSKIVKVENEPIYNYTINNNSIDHKKRNPPEYYSCLFYHIYQCNEFYRFIKHPEWEKSVLKKMGSIFLKKGFNQFYVALKTFLLNYSAIIDAKSKFVNDLKYDK